MNFDLQNDQYINSWQNLANLLKSFESEAALSYDNFKIDEQKFFEISKEKGPAVIWWGKRVLLIPWHAVLCPIYRILFTLYGTYKGQDYKGPYFYTKQWYHVRQDLNLG